MSTDQLISIVDDDPSVREAMESLLRSVGLRSALFSSGEEFLQWEGRERTPCLILDLRLPGMSGLELQRVITSSGAPVPIVFITAHGNEEERRQAMAGGAVEFLRKPFSEDALLAAVHTALARS